MRLLLKSLGPGVITGAADDDPSGIATYSVAGAQLGTKLLWTALLTWPLMAAVQSFVHAARLWRCRVQAFHHLIQPGELWGVAALIIIGISLIVLAPGETPTPTSPSSEKPKPNTRSCSDFSNEKCNVIT
jgi:Mn2+/Fe2+ NRAMP family transporter